MDACIISGDVLCRKPSQEIYRRALQQIGADAADCIFVDDRDKNLIPARDLGMHVIRFVRDGSPCCLDGVPVARSFSNVLTVIQNLW